MNTELVRAVFDCGIDDLRLLDDAECDMYAVIGRMREESIELVLYRRTENRMLRVWLRVPLRAGAEQIATVENIR